MAVDMNKKVKLKVWFFKDGFGIMKPNEWQKKSFKDGYAAMEWCRRNSAKIGCLNDFRTFGEPISHFDVLGAINGVKR